ncbi:hypothetical protein [Streptomyces subrutilus]|uniref:hypothetical protein n=1 Tax=Streptomyces subrutilus TaxID=36818 RepID=UPI002E0D3DF4|nr:hypothetical protein OG479_16655 [Streptomyces subrutilus]
MTRRRLPRRLPAAAAALARAFVLALVLAVLLPAGPETTAGTAPAAAPAPFRAAPDPAAASAPRPVPGAAAEAPAPAPAGAPDARPGTARAAAAAAPDTGARELRAVFGAARGARGPVCDPEAPRPDGVPAVPPRAGTDHGQVPPARPVSEEARPRATAPVRALVRGPEQPLPGPVELSVLRV